jgi:hypothetical protein
MMGRRGRAWVRRQSFEIVMVVWVGMKQMQICSTNLFLSFYIFSRVCLKFRPCYTLRLGRVGMLAESLRELEIDLVDIISRCKIQGRYRILPRSPAFQCRSARPHVRCGGFNLGVVFRDGTKYRSPGLMLNGRINLKDTEARVQAARSGRRRACAVRVEAGAR